MVSHNEEWKRYTVGGQDTLVGLDNNIQNLHRGANHFQYTIIDRVRQHCQQAQDNKELRIKFICGEINESTMKTQLLKRDTQYNKRQALLHVYELMGAIYTEGVIDIHNAMLEFVNETRDDNLEDRSKLPLLAGTVQRVLKRLHKNIMKVERVRIYCNKELIKISAIYNQGVDLIDGMYQTPKFNKEKCKKELLKKNCGELKPQYEYNAHRSRWQIKYEDGYHRNVVYV